MHSFDFWRLALAAHRPLDVCALFPPAARGAHSAPGRKLHTAQPGASRVALPSAGGRPITDRKRLLTWRGRPGDQLCYRYALRRGELIVL